MDNKDFHTELLSTKNLRIILPWEASALRGLGRKLMSSSAEFDYASLTTQHQQVTASIEARHRTSHTSN